MFEEIKLFIPYSLNTLIRKKEEAEEHFTMEDYEKIQNSIRNLHKKQNALQKKIKEQQNLIANMSKKEEKYQTFQHLFENTEERNISYHKMMLFLITLIFLLIICIVSYFIYHRMKLLF